MKAAASLRQSTDRYAFYGQVIEAVMSLPPPFRCDLAPREPTAAQTEMLDEADRAELQGLLVEVLYRLATIRNARQ